MRRRSSGSAAEEEGDDSVSSNEPVNSTFDGAGGRSKSDDSTSNIDSKTIQTTTRPAISQRTSHELDRRKSTDKRPSTARSRRPSNTNWSAESLKRNGQIEKNRSTESTVIAVPSKEAIAADK